VTISTYLEEDHRRIEHLLRQATAFSGRIDAPLFEEFRGALLRHIGVEEKILFQVMRKAAGKPSLPRIEQLHLDHGALAALLVPTPTAAILDAVRTILDRHNLIEEGSGGIYRECEQLPDIDADGIVKRMRAAPPVALNPPNDTEIAMQSMRAAVRRAGYSFDL
jgi:hypothetical protein